ncbi:MAG: glycosyltransferase [Bacteroidaceae bacterium]|nr:glycosyltransferase [Bacteroidaceae bacterium]
MKYIEEERKKNMNSPLISIIIPVYNVEKYLNRCMESVVNQTLKNIEIILIDDGSPDNSPQLCDEWGRKDSRIKVVHKVNEGLGLARNTGMEVATGKYIAFIDSDDYVEPKMYEKLYTKAISNNADIVYCGYKLGLDDGTFTDKSDFNEEKTFENKNDIENLSINYFYPQNGHLMMMSVWHSIYKREIIKTKFFSERIVVSEDLHFQISAILNSKKIIYIPDSLYYYCYNKDSLSHSFSINKFYNIQNLISLLLSIYPNKKKYVYKYFFNFTLNIIRLLHGNKTLKTYEKINHLKNIYKVAIWREVKRETNNNMYIKHHKIVFMILGHNLFWLFYFLTLFDYYIVLKNIRNIFK